MVVASAVVGALIVGGAVMVGTGVLPLPRLIDTSPPGDSPSPSASQTSSLEVVRTALIPLGQADLQVVVEVRNVGDNWLSLAGPNDEGRQEGSLVDDQRRLLMREGTVELWGYPTRLGPGEIGYYVAAPDLDGVAPTAAAGLVFSPRTAVVDGPPALHGSGEDRGYSGDGRSPLTLHVSADWEGAGSAAVAVIAFDEAGEIIGFVHRPRAEPGELELCCIPHPGGAYAEGIADTLVIVVPEEAAGVSPSR